MDRVFFSGETKKRTVKASASTVQRFHKRACRKSNIALRKKIATVEWIFSRRPTPRAQTRKHFGESPFLCLFAAFESLMADTDGFRASISLCFDDSVFTITGKMMCRYYSTQRAYVKRREKINAGNV